MLTDPRFDSTPAAVPPPDSKSETRWSIVVLMMALCFISHINRIGMSIAGDERIMSQYSISPRYMGMIYSSFLIVYTIFMIPGGFFIDRFGPRTALIVVGFGSALFSALTGAVGLGFFAAAQIWWVLMVVRGIMGMVTSPLHPSFARGVSICTPLPQRSLANGLVNGAAVLGIACTYKVVGTLIEKLDWPFAFMITGCVTALITWIWIRKSGEIANRPGRRSTNAAAAGQAGRMTDWTWLILFKNRTLLLLTFGYAAVSYFQYLFFYWVHYYFETVLHFGKSESQYYAAIPNLAMAVGMPFGGWLSDRLQQTLGYRWGRAVVPMVSMASGAILLYLGILAQQTFWVVLWFSLALGAIGVSEGPFWATTVEVGGRRGGTAAAMLNTGGNGIGLLAPVITPWISEYFAWQVGIGVAGLICLLGALCWFWIDPNDRVGEDENGVGR